MAEKSIDDPSEESITADPEEDSIAEDSKKTLPLRTLQRILYQCKTWRWHYHCDTYKQFYQWRSTGASGPSMTFAPHINPLVPGGNKKVTLT